ncbi:MAG: hypothetical protein GF365_02880 [Candidatus Buchananbacteria bacterium]|nr:hypothetical protein [Candidatus Buchananbacteria bacterium]
MREDYLQEIMRGHLDECLANLNHKFANKEQAQTKQILLKSMADFCGVSTDSTRRWLHSINSLPISDKKIKLMCFLDLLGYKIIELENMTESLRGLTEIIAFNLINLSESTKLIGYSNTSRLIEIIYGKENPSPEKKRKVWDVWNAKRQELNQAKQTAFESLPDSIFKVLKDEQEFSVSATDSNEKAALCRANFDGMSNLLKFIRLPSFQNLTDQELFALLSNHDIKILTELADELQKLKNKCLPE